MPGFTYTTKDGLKQTGEIQDRVYVERTARDGSVVGHVEFLRPKVDETLQQAAVRQTVELADMGWYPPAPDRIEIHSMGIPEYPYKPAGGDWDDETPIPYKLTEKGEAFAVAMNSMPPAEDFSKVVAGETIGIVARHAKDQRIANEMSDRLAMMTGGKPRKYTRWQLFRSRMSMRFETFRERLALCIAPWIRDQ